MRIAYVSDFLPGYHLRSGGADWACLRAGELISANNIQVEYFTLYPDPAKASVGTPVRDKTINGIHFIPIIEQFLPRSLARCLEVLKWYILQFDPIAFFCFLNFFLRNRPDIVHIHRIRFLTMSAVLAAGILKIPMCFSVYDYWMFCALETLTDNQNRPCRKFHGLWCWKCLPNKFIWFQQALLIHRRYFFDKCLGRFKKFVVLSRHSAGILKEYGIPEDKIAVIPLPYDWQSYEMESVDLAEPDTLVYIGWIQKRKGLDVLLKALVKVKLKVPGVKLYCLGPDVTWENDYRMYVDNLIREGGLSESVVWVGPVPNKTVQRFIQSAEVVVVPEQWENMSPVIVGEAMFNQRPVIGSRLGGIPDFVIDGKTGLLFDPSSVDDLADKVTTLLLNKALAIEMGKIAAEAAKNAFSSKVILDKYLRLYQGMREAG
ncbi:MAG: glycosyltransferase family 4 protein [Candidatus Omnitrophica bacterium]|nr:glycosyltransferase family 4 protein [Candidatus Omnitrophota bacterium]